MTNSIYVRSAQGQQQKINNYSKAGADDKNAVVAEADFIIEKVTADVKLTIN